MPKFNTANPTNVSGNPLELPEDYLFRMVRETMCEGGRVPLSFDVLLAKGCDRDLLASYESAEALVDAVISDMIERMTIIWERAEAGAAHLPAHLSGAASEEQKLCASVLPGESDSEGTPREGGAGTERELCGCAGRDDLRCGGD